MIGAIAFLTDDAVLDKIIDHLKLTFVAKRPPPPQFAYQQVLMAPKTVGEYFSEPFSPAKEKPGRFPVLLASRAFPLQHPDSPKPAKLCLKAFSAMIYAH
jgi:hypothetical protein